MESSIQFMVRSNLFTAVYVEFLNSYWGRNQEAFSKANLLSKVLLSAELN